jgi:multiple sugar transport system substrate-binding protein
MYNNAMLKKAGIDVPWKPKTWDEILDAARKVKAANPGIVPFWAAAGTSAGPTGILQGSGNLVYGSSTPVMFDDKTQKWVVKSPGLTEVMQFYKTLYSEGLGASTSDLFNPKAVGRPVAMMKDQQLAMALGSNWYAAAWHEENRHWENAKDEAGTAAIPTSKGQAPGAASTLGGWAFAISKSSKNADLAWKLVKVLESDQNSLSMATGSGFVPPSQRVGKLPDFVNYAPPFNAAFNDYLPFAKPLPFDGNFPVYARGLGDATGKLAQEPSTSVDDALKILRDTVVNQIGADKVEELP